MQRNAKRFFCNSNSPRSSRAPRLNSKMNSFLLTERDGPILTLTLNRPERRSALNVALLEELCAALEAYRTMRRNPEATERLRAFAEKRAPNWVK